MQGNAKQITKNIQTDIEHPKMEGIIKDCFKIAKLQLWRYIYYVREIYTNRKNISLNFAGWATI